VLLVVGGVLARLILPAGLAGLALWADGANIGVFNNLDLPLWLVFAVSLILLDFATWFQHWVTHQVPLLWRLHRVHHTDPEIDVTTALRFHPAEIIVSLVWKGAVVVALGVPALAALWFEVLLNALAQFNHANMKLPLWLDRILRLLIVTPDMHRVHHATDRAEHDRNYGFCLSIWDRLFGQYKAQPNDGHLEMTIGQDWLRSSRDQRPDRLLIQPIKTR